MEYQVQILEHHLDSFGHVNNATYLQIYEEARWDFITKRGYGYNEVHSLKQGPVILEVNLKFIKELHLRETISMTLEITERKGKIGKLKQQMILSNGDVASEAIFTVGFFDLKERKLIDWTPAWLVACGIGPA